MSVKSDGPDPLRDLLPKASPELVEFVGKLRANNGALERWLAAHPDQLEKLQVDPQRHLPDLLKEIGLETPPGVKPARLEGVDLHYHASPLPAGAALLNAVWVYVAQSPSNRQAFTTNHRQVIQTVAGSNQATPADTNAVIAVFDQIFGLTAAPGSWLVTELTGASVSLGGQIVVNRRAGH